MSPATGVGNETIDIIIDPTKLVEDDLTWGTFALEVYFFRTIASIFWKFLVAVAREKCEQ